jgi:hypothetical protein
MLDRYGEEQPTHFEAHAIADCHLCDDHGYRGHRVCNHIDYKAAAKRGMEKIRTTLEETKKRKENEQ